MKIGNHSFESNLNLQLLLKVNFKMNRNLQYQLSQAGLWGISLAQGFETGILTEDTFRQKIQEGSFKSGGLTNKRRHTESEMSGTGNDVIGFNPQETSNSSTNLSPEQQHPLVPPSSQPLRGILSKSRFNGRDSSQESEDSTNSSNHLSSNRSLRSHISPVSTVSSASSIFEERGAVQGGGESEREMTPNTKKRVRFESQDDLNRNAQRGNPEDLGMGGDQDGIETKRKKIKSRSGRISVARSFQDEIMY